MEHRDLATEGIDVHAPMHLDRTGGAFCNFVGLWAAKFNEQGPIAITFLLATARAADIRQPLPESTTLGEIPWQILQLHTADQAPTTDGGLWQRLLTILGPELEDSSEQAAAQQMEYNPRQAKGVARSFADDELLRSYKVERIDDPVRLAALPELARSMARDRIAYSVHNVHRDVVYPVPMYLFKERVVPANKAMYNREGKVYSHEGNLRDALEMGRSWIFMAPETRHA